MPKFFIVVDRNEILNRYVYNNEITTVFYRIYYIIAIYVYYIVKHRVKITYLNISLTYYILTLYQLFKV